MMFLLVFFLIASPRILVFLCDRELNRINDRYIDLKHQGIKIDQLHKHTIQLLKMYNDREVYYQNLRKRKPSGI